VGVSTLVFSLLLSQPADPIASPDPVDVASSRELDGPIEVVSPEPPADEPVPTAAPVDPPAPAPTEPPLATTVPPPVPAPGSVSPPAIAKTDATVRNAKHGAESDASHSTYKIGKGWTLASKDGRFSIQLRGRIQMRYDLEHPNMTGTPTRHSLQIRRARLLLQGHVFSPHVKYHFQFGFSPRDMQNDLPTVQGDIRRNPLRDARLEFDRLRDFTVWMGQMKVPFSRQRVISSAYMNLVDRSIVNAEFNLDRDIGVQVRSQDLGGLGGRLAYYAGVFMGEGRNAFDLTDTGLLYVGRFEVLPFGKFDDYTEGDIARTKKPGLSIAGAYAFHDRAHAARGNVGDLPADTGTTDFHHVTADLLFKWRGLSFASAFHLRRGFDRKGGGAVDDMDNLIPVAAPRQGMGWYGQLGWVMPRIPLEFVGRYGLIRNAYGASVLADVDEAGGGINWYFVGHDLKLQLDYFRQWDESMGNTPADAARHGLDRVRVQVQLYF
jgi:hypothetical protein